MKNSNKSSEVCSKCHGTYWILTEEGNAKRCSCYNRELANRRSRFASIPNKYKDVTLESTRIDLFELEQNKKAMKNIIDVVNAYVNEFSEQHENGKGLYFYSQTKGTGKTRMAAALANKFLENYQVKFATSISILEEIKASWGKEREYSESKLIDDLIMTDILIIDDFGIENVKEWINNKFYHIINERYITKRVTIYTSNVPIERLPYDSRITNRVLESTYSISFPEESIRNMIGAYNQMIIKRMADKNENE